MTQFKDKICVAFSPDMKQPNANAGLELWAINEPFGALDAYVNETCPGGQIHI